MIFDALKKKNDVQGTDYQQYVDAGKDDISLQQLVNYNLLFFIPLLICIVISLFIAERIADNLRVNVLTATQILMIPFTFIIFLFIIPYIRKRENLRGVRMSLFGFIIVAFAMAAPSMLVGDFSFLLRMFIFLGTYVLLVFIFSPEVLGIGGNDLADWFKKGRQLSILGIYSAIVFFYVFGFAWVYMDIAMDGDPNEHFNFPREESELTYGTTLYYSVITFATIGYGDITPYSPAARLVAGIEAYVGMIINVLFIAILLVYVSNYQVFSTKQEEEKLAKDEQKLEKAEERLEEENRELREEEKHEHDIIEKLQQQIEDTHERHRKHVEHKKKHS
ncbi:MAG: potassium channel family protein [Nanoarchaeota archaeon]